MPSTTATSDEILRTARALIVAGGYNGFSYADIAAAVGIRKASVHHHFPTKVDLVLTLIEGYRKEAEAGLAAIEHQFPDPVDQLRNYVGFWEGCIADPNTSFCVCALLASQIPVLPDQIALEVRAYFGSLSAWLTAVLDRGAERGRIALSGSARTEAETFMATMHGAMLSARAYDDPTILGSITQRMIERLAASK